ncbi:MAG: serine/threonine-protein kinase [Myxococcota bacterium]
MPAPLTDAGRLAPSRSAECSTGADRASLDPARLDRQVIFEAVGRRLFSERFSPVQFGRFLLLGTLGRGGMGTVFKAYDESLDRSIAIKVLHPGTSEHHADRLRREAQALAKLSHPNVVHVYEVGEVAGQWFIAMELVPGQTLRRWHEGEHDWRARVTMYVRTGAGLAAAHAAGLVHRDFKPDNCIVDQQGRPRVLDFGLVRGAVSSMGSSPSVEPEGSDTAWRTCTQTGAVMGTLGYMPPEQIRGRTVDARSDQFAFCVSLFEALYGDRPFTDRPGAQSRAQVLEAIAKGTIRPAPRGTKVPEVVRKIVVRGLANDPAARWPSMDALLAELERLLAPRKRSWLMLGLAGGLVAVAVGLAFYVEVSFRCEGAVAHLRDTWDDPRRAEVEAALLATGLPYSNDTWEHVRGRLDDYARRWADRHTEVCEATSVRQEQSTEVMDLRMECLRQRRVALKQAVDVLADTGEAEVRNAVKLVANLPALSRCDNVDALRADLPPPEDPAVAHEVWSLRAQLLRASSLERVGRYDDALLVTEQIVEQAEALDYPPLTAEASLLRGRIRDAKGEYPEAQQDLERAYALAAEHGHDGPEAEAAAWLINVVGARRAHHEEGQWWGRTALALARGRHVEPQTLGHALVNLGLIRRAQGELDDALRYFQRALASFESALGPDHPDVAQALRSIGAVHRARGELDDALAHYRRASAIVERTLGPRHPAAAGLLNNIGNVLKRQDEPGEALEHYERASAIIEQALGPKHPHLASMHNNIGNLLQDQGELDDALAHFQISVTIWEQALGPDHPSVADALHNIGSLMTRRYALPEAQEHFVRALTIREAALGPEHPDVADTLTNLSVVLGNLGQWDDALTYLQRALAIHEKISDPEGLQVARLHNNLSAILRHLDRLPESRTHSLRALSIREKKLGPDHPEVAVPLTGLVVLDLAEGDLDQARARAQRAVAINEDRGQPEQLAWSRFMLAQALWPAPDQRARALALARLARETTARLGKHQQAQLSEIDTWLAEHGEH